MSAALSIGSAELDSVVDRVSADPVADSANVDRLGVLILDQSLADSVRADAVRALCSHSHVPWDVVDYVRQIASVCLPEAKSRYNAGPNLHVASKYAISSLEHKCGPVELRLHPPVQEPGIDPLKRVRRLLGYCALK
jgi:hypothetical protein